MLQKNNRCHIIQFITKSEKDPFFYEKLIKKTERDWVKFQNKVRMKVFDYYDATLSYMKIKLHFTKVKSYNQQRMLDWARMNRK